MRQNPFYFSTIFEFFVLILFSLHFEPQKSVKKTFIFCFCSVPFLFHFFFQHVLCFFHHFFLCSLLPYIILFISFSVLTFFFSLISPFFLFFSISVCVSLSLYDRGQNTSPREMSEGGGGNGHQCLKRRSFVGVFFSMTEGLS